MQTAALIGQLMDRVARPGAWTAKPCRRERNKEGLRVRQANNAIDRRTAWIAAALFFAMVFVGPNARAQTFFKVLGTPAADEYGQCVQAGADGNFFVGGTKGDSALIMKVDPLGHILWSLCMQPIPGFRNIIFHMAPAPDGNMIATGNVLESPSLGIWHTFILKFDLAGNVIWINRPPMDRPIWTHRTLPVSNTEYMMLTEIYDMSSPTYPDLFTARLDAATGALIGHGPLLDYIPSNSYIDDIRCATLGLGGHVYISGRIYLNGSAPSGMRPFITKFNATGDHLWSKYLMFPATVSARIYGSDIAFTGDSLILAYYGDLNGASSNYSIGLVRTDTMGNVAWTKDYKIQGYTSAMAFAVLRMPYGYALTGYATSGANSDLFAIATDQVGEVLWARKFGSPNTTEDLSQPYTLHALAIGSDILLTGSRQAGGSSDIILARMDQNGDIDCLTSAPLVIQTTTVPPFSTALSPQPIPNAVSMPLITAPSSAPVIEELCPAIALDLGPDTALCSPVELDATTPNASYTWSTGSHAPSIQADAPGAYWVEVTVDCCVYTDTVTFLSGPPPTADFSVPNITCDPEVAPVNNSIGAATYLWDFGDGFTSTDANPVHDYAGPGLYSISLTATSPCGSDIASMDLEIFTMGALTVTGPDTLCQGATGDYSATLTGATPTSILWSTGETTPDIQLTVNATILLEVDAEDANGCPYNADLLVYAIPQPTAAFQFNALRCDTLVSFQDASTHAGTWQWDLGNGQTSFLPSPTGLYPAPGTYNVQQVVGNACGTDTVTQQLVLGPEGTINLAGPDSLCAGETGTYTVTLQGATLTSVEWTPVDGDQPTVQAAFSGNTLLGVTVMDDQHCEYAASLPVQVIPGPVASFSVLTAPCDSMATFSSTSANGDAFLWDFGNGNTSQAPEAMAPIPAGDTLSVILVAINACGMDTAHQEVWHDPGPTLRLKGPALICSDAPITLSLDFPGTLSHIQWSTGDTSLSISTAPVDGGTITVIALSDEGCVLSASYTVHFSGDGGHVPFYVPNVFTPNNDGINDVFRPEPWDAPAGLMIFNRWGELIYEASGVGNGWKGYHDGRPVPDGTYVYIVRWYDSCSNQDRENIGHVTLLR